MQPASFQRNNFDLIRLFAASQVMIIHGLHHLNISDVSSNGLLRFFNFLPGVPIFFFISGFLISASYSRSRTVGNYARNRLRRIYPALWLCLAISILLVLLSGYPLFEKPSTQEFFVWLAAQSSVVQFYNPDFLRDYGIGALNGSLWTISVELQFYIMMPLLAAILTQSERFLWILLVGMVVIHTIFVLYLRGIYGDTLVFQLLSVTFVPWICMFMLGHMAQRHWGQIAPLVAGRFVPLAGLYAVMIVLGIWLENTTGMRLSGNNITIVWYGFLIAFVLSAAYTKEDLSYRFLRGNDISYGIYIYHMPVINFWIQMGWPGTVTGLVSCMMAVFALASASWFLLERPVLRAKKATLLVR